MKYSKNRIGSIHSLDIVLSASEICCYEPFVVQSLLRFGSKSINLWLDYEGTLHIDTFFCDYDTRENFCQIIDTLINSSHKTID